MRKKILPIESKAQEISRFGNEALILNKPKNWIASATPGESDYGFDYLIQYKNTNNNELNGIFFIQLKTKLNVKYIKNMAVCEIEFKNLNFYHYCSAPILIVLCDLKGDMDNHNAVLYYIWSHEIKINYSTKQMHFRIPASNILNKKLDVFPILDEISFRYQNLFKQDIKNFIRPFTSNEIQENNSYCLGIKYVRLQAFLPSKENPYNASCLLLFAISGINEVMITFRHETIMSNLFPGISNNPSTKKRGFVLPLPSINKSNEVFIQLGNIRLLIKQELLHELCAIVDQYSQHYLRRLQYIEEMFKLRNFQRATNDKENIPLMCIPRRLWKEMVIVASQYDSLQEKSRWHIFLNYNNNFLLIDTTSSNPYYHAGYHASIKAMPDSHNHNCTELEHTTILAWVYPSSLNLKCYADISKKGVWDAEYTYQWIKKHFIPFVLNQALKRYNKKQKNEKIYFEYLEKNINRHVHSLRDNPLLSFDNITNHEELTEFFRRVQEYVATYSYSINKSVYISKEKSDLFYDALILIFKHANLYNNSLHYINTKLNTTQYCTTENDFINEIKKQKINNPIIDTFSLELILRVFCQILEGSNKKIQQTEINILKSKIDWLWFEIDQFLFLERNK